MVCFLKGFQTQTPQKQPYPEKGPLHGVWSGRSRDSDDVWQWLFGDVAPSCVSTDLLSFPGILISLRPFSLILIVPIASDLHTCGYLQDRREGCIMTSVGKHKICPRHHCRNYEGGCDLELVFSGLSGFFARASVKVLSQVDLESHRTTKVFGTPADFTQKGGQADSPTIQEILLEFCTF